MKATKGYQLKARVEENTLRGVASVMGVRDLDDDVIMPGAFKGALREFRRTGFVANSHIWSWNNIIAMPTDARENGNQLVVEATWHSTPLAQEARTVAMERIERGLAVGLSIGFSFQEQDQETFPNGQQLVESALARGYSPDLIDIAGLKGARGAVRAIYRIRSLYEFSLVPVPANPLAAATDVKAVAPFRGAIPLAERDRDWSAPDAIARIRRWAGGDQIDWDSYVRAFFWFDAENREAFGSYKLPYCDIIGGELHAIPRAIFAVAGVLEGARGGTDIPENEQARIRTVVSRWYDRMRQEFGDDSIIAPWERDAKSLRERAAVILTATDVEVTLAKLGVTHEQASAASAGVGGQG